MELLACIMSRWLSHVPDLKELSVTLEFTKYLHAHAPHKGRWHNFKSTKQLQVDKEKESGEIKWLGQGYTANG